MTLCLRGLRDSLGENQHFQGDQEGSATSQLLPDPVLVPALAEGGEKTGEHSEEETRG